MITIKEYLESCEKIVADGGISVEQVVECIEDQTELIQRMSKIINLSERALERSSHFKSNEGQQALLRNVLDQIRELRG